MTRSTWAGLEDWPAAPVIRGEVDLELPEASLPLEATVWPEDALALGELDWARLASWLEEVLGRPVDRDAEPGTLGLDPCPLLAVVLGEGEVLKLEGPWTSLGITTAPAFVRCPTATLPPCWPAGIASTWTRPRRPGLSLAAARVRPVG